MKEANYGGTGCSNRMAMGETAGCFSRSPTFPGFTFPDSGFTFRRSGRRRFLRRNAGVAVASEQQPASCRMRLRTPACVVRQFQASGAASASVAKTRTCFHAACVFPESGPGGCDLGPRIWPLPLKLWLWLWASVRRLC